jgi:hypothetical protein
MINLGKDMINHGKDMINHVNRCQYCCKSDNWFNIIESITAGGPMNLAVEAYEPPADM